MEDLQTKEDFYYTGIKMENLSIMIQEIYFKLNKMVKAEICKNL